MTQAERRIEYLTIKAVESLIDMPNTLERIVKDKAFIAIITVPGCSDPITIIDFTKKMTYDLARYKAYCQEIYDDFAQKRIYYQC